MKYGQVLQLEGIKMLDLYSYLTKEDNDKIKNYILKYGSAYKFSYIGNEQYLKYWRDNKKKLFHLLGGELILKIPFEYNRNVYQINQEIHNLQDHPFLEKYLDLIYASDIEDFWDRQAFRSLVSDTALATNEVLDSVKYQLNDNKKILQIQQGGKALKAIQKVINYFNPENKELLSDFEDFRIKHSLILNTKKIKGNLCFSIHPLDFMTMSDNNSGWSSCMSWKAIGCYRAGTIEMMNSNNVICVYLESDETPFNFSKEKTDVWNNKKWRQLFYCTKDIIVSGKPYPYVNEELTKKALNVLRELAYKNWNRKYSFGIEEYRDMKHIFSYSRMERNKNWIFSNNTTKHNIIFDTKGMYNDMLNDQNTTYWCVRNKVKKNTIISYSGKAPCLCCMKSLLIENKDFYEYDEDAYNDRYENLKSLICEDCSKKLKK